MSNSTPKRGRPKKPLVLTQTDRAVLIQIALKGFQSYQELRPKSLKAVNRQHSWKLMKRLVHMGLLVESSGDAGSILGWSLSEKARQTLDQGQDGSPATKQRAPTYRTSYRHDIVLREVEDILRQTPVIIDWVPEHVLRGEIMTELSANFQSSKSEKLALIPDALLTMMVGSRQFKVALELELTRKTKKRIYKKIEAHILNPKFNFVFFIAEDRNLQKHLWNIYQDILSSSILVKFKKNQNGIYFTNLDHLRVLGTKVVFVGAQNSFCLANLSP